MVQAALVSACVGELLLASGCARRQPVRPISRKPAPDRSSVVVVQRNATTTQYDAQQRPLWSATADRLVLRKESGTAELTQAECKLYRHGQLAWIAKAPVLKADQPRKRLTLEGGISARSADGSNSFQAPAATWNAETGEIRSQGGVVFNLGKARLVGGALRLSTLDGSFTIDGGAPPPNKVAARAGTPGEAPGSKGAP